MHIDHGRCRLLRRVRHAAQGLSREAVVVAADARPWWARVGGCSPECVLTVAEGETQLAPHLLLIVSAEGVPDTGLLCRAVWSKARQGSHNILLGRLQRLVERVR